MAAEDVANLKLDGESEPSKPAEAPAPPPKPKVRLYSYQTDSDFVVSQMAKNLTKEISVVFGDESVKFDAKLPGGSDYNSEIKCARKINPDNCSFKVMSTKVEIRLRKLEGGIWPSLEAEKAVNDVKPSYPSSSTERNDWDTMEKEIKKQEEEEPYENVNSLFAKIYNPGDENTRRAMIKSMQQSNGTVLSTSWEEVGKKEVEVAPPDGMQYNKWE